MKSRNAADLDSGPAPFREPAREPSWVREPRLSASRELAIYVILTGLVWGLFAVDRGMWQDDVIVLRFVHNLRSFGQSGFFAAYGGSATRRLLNLPALLAIWSGSPLLFLQMLYGLTWLGNGWLTRAICLEFLPGRPLAAFLAGALAICATSDSLTNSLVSITYDVSVLFFLGAFLLAIRWLRGARWPTLAAVPFLLACSYLTTEGAFTSMILAPGAFLVATWGRLNRRLAVLLLIWAGALAPFLWFFLAYLSDPNGYASAAILPMTLSKQVRMGSALVANNFAPWQWLFRRPTLWGPNPPAIIPTWVYLVASVAGTVLVLVPVLRRRWESGSRSDEATDRPLATWIVAGGGLALAIAANLAFARIQFAPNFYRTHVMSRIWASIAVAAVTAGIAELLGKRFRFAMLIPAAFVGFGIAGGIERQDFYLASWRTHRAELRSVVEQVPGLRAEAQMILLMPTQPRFQALSVPYIGKSWLDLIYDDASMESRSIFLTPSSLTACTAESGGFRCREGGPGRSGSNEPTLPYSKAVLLAFSTRDDRFHLLDQLPATLMKGHTDWGSDYHPRLLVERREISSLGRHLLYGPDGLARFLDSPSAERNAPAWERYPMKVGDFDADGRPDILWRDNDTGANTLRFMNGTKAVRSAVLPPLTETGWQLAGTGDFNGDGKADILWRNTKTGVNTVWFMDGATRRGWAYIPGPPEAAWQLAGVGDFNGDGKPDILWRNAKTGVNTVWFLKGVISSGWAYIPGPPEPAWQLAGVGDFNGDGKADILWRNTKTGVTTVWFTDGTRYTGWTYLQGLPDVVWRIEGVADFDGDGKPDILWRYGATQETVVWFLNGTEFVRSDHVPPVPGLTD